MTYFLFYLFHRLLRKDRRDRDIPLLPFCLLLLIARDPSDISSLYAYGLHALLLYQALSDHLSEEISMIPDLFIILIGIVCSVRAGRPLPDLFLSFLLPLTLYLLSLSGKIGDGDAEVFFALSFYYSLYPLALILFTSSFLALLYSYIEKRDRYPFVPFIFISSILIYSL